MKTHYSNEFKWITKDTEKFLKEGYLEEGVDPIERIEQICNTAESRLGIDGFSNKMFDYMSKGWISLSSPIWANYGLNRGLSISCFNVDIQDETSDILRAVSEVGMMSKVGGGTSGYFGNIRPRGSKISGGGESNGSVSFMELFDSVTNVVSQNGIRRGSFVATLPIEHPDVNEFLTLRETGSSIQRMSLGISITDDWMQSMIDGDKEKRKLWARILQKRTETGYPYIFFKDTVNKNKPQVYKDLGYEINSSNLCQEVMLPSSDKESFVCCLSSLNLLHYDEWKETDLVETLAYFLDTVLDEYIEKASEIPFLEKTVEFTKNHRSIGIGVLGWHSYLQSKMIPFEGLDAKMKNAEIFKFIQDKSIKASKELAKTKGEAPILKGRGLRFTTTRAIAPTTSSSFILGQVSPSIEPLASNYFIKDLAKGKFTYKNPYLKTLLKSRDKDTQEVWDSILMKGGSVQHLGFLTQDEKDVFKTFSEISQLEVVQQAAQRQVFIDQGQSLNLMIHPEVSVKELNALMIEAWKLGIKTLYYQRGVNLAQDVSRKLTDCTSCEA